MATKPLGGSWRQLGQHIERVQQLVPELEHATEERDLDAIHVKAICLRDAAADAYDEVRKIERWGDLDRVAPHAPAWPGTMVGE